MFSFRLFSPANRNNYFKVERTKSTKTQAMAIGDIYGDTLLHCAIRICEHPAEIEEFIQRNGMEAACIMATTVNNNGNLPLDLIKNTKLSHSQKEQLHSILMRITVPSHFKKLSEPVNTEEVLKRYSFSPESRKYQYLKLGCEIANEVRKVFKVSNSHPEINAYLPSEREKITEKISRMREEIDSTLSFPKKKYLRLVQECERQHIGNCYEFTGVALNRLRRKDATIPAYFCYLKPGDHDFLIIDDLVVCDAWAGEVYLCSEIKEKLKDHRCFVDGPDFLHVLTSYNPEYHKVNIEYSFLDLFNEEEKKPAQVQEKKATMFAVS